MIVCVKADLKVRLYVRQDDVRSQTWCRRGGPSGPPAYASVRWFIFGPKARTSIATTTQHTAM